MVKTKYIGTLSKAKSAQPLNEVHICTALPECQNDYFNGAFKPKRMSGYEVWKLSRPQH